MVDDIAVDDTVDDIAIDAVDDTVVDDTVVDDTVVDDTAVDADTVVVFFWVRRCDSRNGLLLSKVRFTHFLICFLLKSI